MILVNDAGQGSRAMEHRTEEPSGWLAKVATGEAVCNMHGTEHWGAATVRFTHVVNGRRAAEKKEVSEQEEDNTV